MNKTEVLSNNETAQEISSDSPKIPVEVIEGKILTDPKFHENYEASRKFTLKYAYADALIYDGRYPKPVDLMRDFISPTSVLKLEPEELILAEELKSRLSYQLIKQGLLEPDDKQAEQAQEEVLRIIDRDERLIQLQEFLPIELMGAVVSVTQFENISDQVKREKLRAFVTRALIRPYIGNILTGRPLSSLELSDIIDLIPDQVFDNVDEIVNNIARGYLENEAMKFFIPGENQGFARLEQLIRDTKSTAKQTYLQQIYEEFRVVQKTIMPQGFVDHVEAWTGENSPFPHFRQKYFVHEFLKTKRKLLNGSTGATKTACSYLAMEAVGAKRVTVLGPAKARNTWYDEAQKLFTDDSRPDVFLIENRADLNNPRIETAGYVFVSNSLMSNAQEDQDLYNLLEEALISRRQTDGLVLDESDDYKKPTSGRSQTLITLAEKMISQYEQKAGGVMPTVALTATPLASSLKDLDVTMGLLYPELFSFPKRNGNGKTPFSTRVLNDPQLARSLLIGEKLMIQWNLVDLFGEHAPHAEYERVKVEMTPYQSVIYDWVVNLPVTSLTKMSLLRSTLMNPQLIRGVLFEHYRSLIPEPVYTQQELVERLYQLHSHWGTWMLTKDIAIADEPFSADWIAKYDEADLLMQCFFDERLHGTSEAPAGGIDNLALKKSRIRTDWKTQDTASAKYSWLKKFIKEHAWPETGIDSQPREKIMMVVPYQRRGITRWLEDTHIPYKDLEDNTLSLFEYLRSEWLPAHPKHMAINIDGIQTINRRSKHSKLWREKGKENVWAVATMDSIYESMDWSIRDHADNKNIDKASIIIMGWPWGWDEFVQLTGRFVRPGMGKPANIYVLETENTADAGFYDNNRMKKLLTQVVLAGIPLTKEEQEFFDKSTRAEKIIFGHPTGGQRFVRDVIKRFKGAGEAEILQELSLRRNGTTLFELFAQNYFNEGLDRYSRAGSNAELAKNILLEAEPKKIISIGAGTCLFARRVVEAGHTQVAIDNIDINGAMLRLAKDNCPQIGAIRVEKASDLKAGDESYDSVECSFMLPWTQLYGKNSKLPSDSQEIERVKILSEMNRVLKTGGRGVMAFPDSSFDEASYTRFVKVLQEHFGFEVIEPSGMSYTSEEDVRQRIGWVITFTKRGGLTFEKLDPSNLEFLSDAQYKISEAQRKKHRIEQTLIHIEYPVFSSDRFIIRNPLSGKITESGHVNIAKSNGTLSIANQEINGNGIISESTPTIIFPKPDKMVMEIKEIISTDKTYWSIWRRLRRRIGKELEYNYEDAERWLARVLYERNLHTIDSWQDGNKNRIMQVVSRTLIQTKGGKKYANGRPSNGTETNKP